MTEPLGLESFFPDRESKEPLAMQLTRRLREAIQTGVLPVGTRLLGTRQFAKRLGLGRNTVAFAFEQLTAEGYLSTRVGSGTVVAAAGLARSSARVAVDRDPSPRARQLSSLRASFTISTGAGPLRPGTPDLSKFPHAAWNRSARKALHAYQNDLGYGRASGLPALQSAIAAHVRQFRGITAFPKQVLIVEGAQAALNLIASVLTSAGEPIVLEDPCYALARAVFEFHGFPIVAAPVDHDGLRVETLPPKASLAFVTPTHQFPLGGAMPVTRRNELLRWATESNAYVIEDDYDSEFTSSMQPLPPLQCLDRDERVIYVGSFSKTLAPAIRVGYIIVPPHLVDAFTIARAVSGLGVSIGMQATLADFIARGHFARHVHRMNGIYERRRNILVSALQPALQAGFRMGPALSGLHVALLAPPGFDDVAAATSIDRQRLVALSTLCITRKDCSGVLLGFTNGSDSEIENAAREVASAFARLLN